ncbi:MAG: alanine racemase [Thermoanaerobaculia bacterium]
MNSQPSSPELRLSSRPTRAVVDLGAIVRNYRSIARLVGRGVKVYPVVKADAYGHGAVPVARCLAEEGADRFAVAIAEEGIALRRAGLRGQVLLVNYSDPGDVGIHRAYGLTPALYGVEHIAGFAEATQGLPEPLPVHLKIDSGMGRLGVRPEDLPAAIAVMRRARGLRLVGTFSNFSSADEPSSPSTAAQTETMKACLETLRAAGVDPGLVHLANSAGLLLHPSSHFHAVRPGLALYGVLPLEDPGTRNFEPALELETRVMSVQRVPAGSPLGYGGGFVTRRASTIAALPIGYHDGLRRSFSGRMSVLLRGGKAPIVGAVSMDVTLVDATECGAEPGDRAVVLGREADRRVTAWDLARAAGTIPYEILCGIGARVPRVYRR